jgi:hypothetical protein
MGANEHSARADRSGEGRMRFDGKTGSTAPEELRGT